MKQRLLQLLLAFAKYSGGFRLTAWLTRKELRILCYHGTAYADEHAFWPGVFMQPDTFKRRLDLIKKSGYPVLSLQDGMQKLHADALTQASVVITIDDGWLGTEQHMWPALKAHNFPATLYVASYYCVHQLPVSNVLLQYLLWSAKPGQVLSRVGAKHLNLESSWSLGDPEARDAISQLLRDKLLQLPAQQERQLLQDVADELEQDLDKLIKRGTFMYSTLAGLQRMNDEGLDLQLHTHTHRFGNISLDKVEREINKNRQHVDGLREHPARHFCYPSGLYRPEQLAVLSKLGIETATTCVSGLVRKDDSALELNRFLDNEQWSELKLEAELSGFLPLMRRWLKAFRR